MSEPAKVVEVGDKFGQWTVLEIGMRAKGRAMCKVRCSCGTVKNVVLSSLRGGRTRGCAKCGRKKSKKAGFGRWVGRTMVVDEV